MLFFAYRIVLDKTTTDIPNNISSRCSHRPDGKDQRLYTQQTRRKHHPLRPKKQLSSNQIKRCYSKQATDIIIIIRMDYPHQEHIRKIVRRVVEVFTIIFFLLQRKKQPMVIYRKYHSFDRNWKKTSNEKCNVIIR